MAESLKAHAWKMRHTLFQISSPLVRLDFVGVFYTSPPQVSAGIRHKKQTSMR
jgi:hypothetical protein